MFRVDIAFVVFSGRFFDPEAALRKSESYYISLLKIKIFLERFSYSDKGFFVLFTQVFDAAQTILSLFSTFFTE
jgi:hypothetical protein